MTAVVPMSTAMLTAIQTSDFDAIYLLLEQGEDLYAEGEYIGSMLTRAARDGWTEIVKLMLDRGADVNHQDSDGSFPLIEAVAAEHEEMVDLLIGRGANVNLVTEGNTALMMARMVGHEAIRQALVAAGAKEILLTPEGQQWEQEEAEKRKRQLELARSEFASREENKNPTKAWVGAWATDEGWGVWVYHQDGTIMSCSEFGTSEAGRMDDPGNGTLVKVWNAGATCTYSKWQVSKDGQRLNLHLDSDTVITMTRL